MTEALNQKILFLTEYIPVRFSREAIPDGLGETLWRKYSAQIGVDFPTPKTDGQWQLTSHGWVGFIPCSQDLGISLRPKVELGNLFHMLEYAYHLKSFQFLRGVVDCKSLEDFYERLALVLAKRVLDRGRKGFYRTYLPEEDDLPFLRGRMNIRQTISRPWEVKVQCRYEEHTSDIEKTRFFAGPCYVLPRVGCAQNAFCLPCVVHTTRLEG